MTQDMGRLKANSTVFIVKKLLYLHFHEIFGASTGFVAIMGGRQGRVPEPTQRAEIRNSAITDSRHQITALDGCCKVR